jgi:hypothetical protein
MPGHMAGVVHIPIEALDAIQHNPSIYKCRIYGNTPRSAAAEPQTPYRQLPERFPENVNLEPGSAPVPQPQNQLDNYMSRYLLLYVEAI